jgi:PhoPQ-activated pathogenicity-related protein
VTGASKRGWTTWLTGAADSRVKGIAPMVIDVLNMAAQMPHQLEVWGAYSDEIDDYTERGIQDRMAIPEGQKLNSIVDPFSYRDRLTMPKLILIGTNDPYWPVDAVNLYFDQLKGEKHILYVPNAGHDLGDGRRAIAGIVAFFMSVASGTPLPAFSWDVKRDGNSAVLTVKAGTKPIEVNLWSATTPTRDFRPSPWQKVAMSAGLENSYRANVEIPQTGHIAFYGELVYPIIGGQRYSLCTPMNVFGRQ